MFATSHETKGRPVHELHDAFLEANTSIWQAVKLCRLKYINGNTISLSVNLSHIRLCLYYLRLAVYIKGAHTHTKHQPISTGRYAQCSCAYVHALITTTLPTIPSLFRLTKRSVKAHCNSLIIIMGLNFTLAH